HDTLARDAAVEGKNDIKRHGGQRLEVCLLLGEVFQDDAAGGGVPAPVSDGVEPVAKLGIQIVEVAEGAAEKEVFPDVAEGALHLALSLCPIGRASLRQKPIMRRQIKELAIVGDALIIDLTQYHRLHAVVEDLRRCSAQRLEGGDVAAQNGLQVLVRDKAAPHHPTMTEHQRKQPNDPLGTGLVGEGGAEIRKINLGLLARRGLEAAFKDLQRLGRMVRRKSFTAV